MSISLASILTTIGLFGWLTMADAQAPVCHIPTDEQTTCSFTALNGPCTVTVNRFHPVSTPTIYMRRGALVTVRVLNPSPFEKVTLDLKSATAQVPPDEFANGFSNLTTALAGFAIAQPSNAPAAPAALPNYYAYDGGALATAPTAESIAKDQAELLRQMKDVLDPKKNPTLKGLSDAIRKVHLVELPLPTNACDTPDVLGPWIHTAEWGDGVVKELGSSLKPLTDLFNSSYKGKTFAKAIAALQEQIDTLADDLDDPRYDILKSNQKQLNDAFSVLQQLQQQINGVHDTVKEVLTHPPSSNFNVRDFQRHDADYELQVWSLNYENRLANIGKRVAADKYVAPDAISFSGILDQPNKQTFATITVQYQHEPIFELSTGFMVPARPYRSYAAAESAAQSSGSTGPVVQESYTWTVVPAAFFNFPVVSWTAKKHRMALLGTAAIGYTPASSSVALAGGPSFSFGSVVISALVDYGRDTRLAGGWTIGAPLGTTTAPQTSTFWDPKFAPGISVRVPIGK